MIEQEVTREVPQYTEFANNDAARAAWETD
jgi:hypothetical protein